MNALDKAQKNTYIGIDLAGNEQNPSGWCILIAKENFFETKIMYSDEELIRKTMECSPLRNEGIRLLSSQFQRPKIIAIDAPLSLPKSGVNRTAENEMRRLGFRIFPPLFSKGMKTLTERGIEISKKFREKGVQVIEVHPTSSMRALDLNSRENEKLTEVFLEFELDIDLSEKKLVDHEFDALVAAFTAFLYDKGLCLSVGDIDEGQIIIPRKVEGLS